MTALHALPRDVLARCLEFLPFDQALEAKQVSKVVRSAARRALTGRWRSIMFVEEQGLDLIENSLTTPNEWSQRRIEVRRALWADPELAAYFVFHLVERLPEPTGFEFVDFDDYWDWSANWWDRYKSSDFLSTAQEIIARESQWP